MSILKKRWKAIRSNSRLGESLRIEDNSIYTEDHKLEVLGCSEWLRCDFELLKYICRLHNKQIEKQGVYKDE